MEGCTAIGDAYIATLSMYIFHAAVTLPFPFYDTSGIALHGA